MTFGYKPTKHIPETFGSWKGESSIILAIEGSEQKPRLVETTKKAIIIGSSNECDITIDDPYISRRHCKIVREGSTLLLGDLDSTNGTFVGSTRINKATLYGEETITVGQTKVKIRVPELAQKQEIKSLGKMIGESEVMQAFFTSLERLANSDVSVCITGETGTGKEIAAKTIHEMSSKKSGSFIAVNCGAFPPTLIESQLFGYEKGSFTGATESHQGFFEQANKGTLFLDEIGEMPLDLQTRLLRVLEEKSVRRLGGKSEIKTDFRLITATHRDLKELVKTEKFRFDLFWRIYVAPLYIPSLSQRGNDIKLLSNHFIKEFTSPKAKTISKNAMNKLMAHTWPGNVRELRNVIQRASLESSTGEICPENIQIETIETAKQDLNLEQSERQRITSALEQCGGKRQQAAEMLGIARSTLAEKLKKYKIK